MLHNLIVKLCFGLPAIIARIGSVPMLLTGVRQQYIRVPDPCGGKSPFARVLRWPIGSIPELRCCGFISSKTHQCKSEPREQGSETKDSHLCNFCCEFIHSPSADCNDMGKYSEKQRAWYFLSLIASHNLLTVELETACTHCLLFGWQNTNRANYRLLFFCNTALRNLSFATESTGPWVSWWAGHWSLFPPLNERKWRRRPGRERCLFHDSWVLSLAFPCSAWSLGWSLPLSLASLPAGAAACRKWGSDLGNWATCCRRRWGVCVTVHLSSCNAYSVSQRQPSRLKQWLWEEIHLV